ncbi:MAG: FtsX-like permease family protein [Thermomicrobiales bacterium]
MNAIVRKALADLRTYRFQSAMVAIIVFAATTTLVLALTLQRGADDPWANSFEQANGAHIAFNADLDDDVSEIYELPGVEAVRADVPTLWGTGIVVNGRKHEVVMYGMVDLPEINRPVLTDGRWLDPGDQRGIVLSRSFAKDLEIDVGDSVGVPLAGTVEQFEVVGLAINVNRGPYPNWDVSSTWALPETLFAIDPDAENIHQSIFVRLTDPEATDAFIGRAYAAVPALSQYGTDDWIEARDSVNEWNQLITIFLGVFSLFAFAAVGFVIANVISGRVLAQFREIGLLKAIGFTPRQAALIFLVQNLALALAAGIGGVAAAAIVAPVFLRRTADVMNAGTPDAFYPDLALLALVVVQALAALFTLLPAWRGGRISTAQALTKGFEAPQHRPGLIARIAAAIHLPLVVVMGVKDAFARPMRAGLTVAALTITVLTVTFGLSMEATARKILDEPAMNGNPFDISVEPGELSEAETREILEANDAVAGLHTRGTIRMQVTSADDGVVSFSARVLGGDYQGFPYAISTGRMIAAPGEAVAGIGLFNLLGLDVGDDLNVTVDGRAVPLHIVGRDRE